MVLMGQNTQHKT